MFPSLFLIPPPTPGPCFTGWAHAMNTPFKWAKQIASHYGGVRNPMVISWPKRIKEDVHGQVSKHRGPNLTCVLSFSSTRRQHNHTLLHTHPITPFTVPHAVAPRHRHRPDHPRRGGREAALQGQRRGPEAHRGRLHAVHLRRRRRGEQARDAVLRDGASIGPLVGVVLLWRQVSRSLTPAFVVLPFSAARQPGHLQQGLDGGDDARCAALDRRGARRRGPHRRLRVGAL